MQLNVDEQWYPQLISDGGIYDDENEYLCGAIDVHQSMSPKQMRKLQREDHDIAVVMRWIESGKEIPKMEKTSTVRTMLRDRKNLFISDTGLLKRK